VVTTLPSTNQLPTEAGPVRHLTIDHRVVVGECNRLPPVAPEAMGDRPQPGAQRAVVVGLGIASDSGGYGLTIGGGGERLVLGKVRPSSHQHCPGAADCRARIGGADRVLVGELHAIVQAEVAAAQDLVPGTDEHIGRRDTDTGDAVLGCDRRQLTDIVVTERIRQWLRSPHGVEA
jgi:hypothetical protein